MTPIETTDLPEEAELRQLLEGAGPRPEFPEEDLEAIRTAARFAWAARQRQTLRRRQIRLAFAAAAAIAVVALGLFRTERQPIGALVERVVGEVEVRRGRRSSPPVAGDHLTAGTSLVTAADGRISLRLVSGTVLRLDRDTRLQLGDGVRLTLSAGGLYADSGPGRPLDISTPGGVVRDIGTQFMVRVDAATATVSVAIREGHVELHREGRVTAAAAGEALVVGADGQVARRAISGRDEAWAWTAEVSPAFAAEGRTLGEFLGWFERETGRSVAFAEPGEAATANAIVLHGSLRGLEPTEALETLAAGAGFEVSEANGHLVLRSVRNPSALPR